jgi:hypothetical protein
MSRIWGMIKSLQIILLFPLALVNIPPNVQLLYFFMTYSCNTELVPSDFDYVEEASGPFNDKFEDQGYKSVFFLVNSASQFNNVNIVLLIGISIDLISKVLIRFKR